jgi:hypothetical protein
MRIFKILPLHSPNLMELKTPLRRRFIFNIRFVNLHKMSAP